MAQQMVQGTVHKNEMAFQPNGLARLAAGLVKLPVLIIKGFAAAVSFGFRIFIATAEQVGLPR